MSNIRIMYSLFSTCLSFNYSLAIERQKSKTDSDGSHIQLGWKGKQLQCSNPLSMRMSDLQNYNTHDPVLNKEREVESKF